VGRSRVVPNGVEPSEWHGPAAAPPDWYDGLARPRIAYVGTLDERLDVERLTELARALPHASLVLAGPDRAPGLLEELAREPNVTVRGTLKRADVAAIVRAADVCLLPHRATRFTLAMSPLKVYEYLAGGSPVVATDLPPVHGVHERVTLLAPGAPLAAAVTDAAEAGRLPESERQAFIDENSWSRRHDALLDLALARS
jgi:glycosyltransferase involved in cell wall biosynthesis